MSLTSQRFIVGQLGESFAGSSVVVRSEVAAYCINRLALLQPGLAGNQSRWWSRPGYPCSVRPLSSNPGNKTMTQTHSLT